MSLSKNTDNNSQIPADMNTDDNIEAGNDTTEVPTNTPVNLKTEAVQTDVIKQDVVLKLQPISDIDIDIWSKQVGQYHIFKADSSVGTPITEDNSAQDGYHLHE